MGDVEKPLATYQRILSFRVFGLSMGKKESRRADSNRPPAPATSDNSCVAGVCAALQIPHILAAFSSPLCWVLHRIAFPVVSEWYQSVRICSRVAAAQSLLYQRLHLLPREPVAQLHRKVARFGSEYPLPSAHPGCCCRSHCLYSASGRQAVTRLIGGVPDRSMRL